MRIKSYFADSVEGAISKARTELGADAMLVNSRPAPPEARALGRYEVVFGVIPGNTGHREATSGPVAASAQPDGLSAELAALRKQLENLSKTISRPGSGGREPASLFPELEDLHGYMLDNDVDADLAREIVLAAEVKLTQKAPNGATGEAVYQAVSAEVMCRFKSAPALGRSTDSTSVVALVGPPGAGKTTTLVKLAVLYGVAVRRPVRLISIDSEHVAAAAHLNCYAAILGVPLETVEGVGKLDSVLRSRRDQEMILIDTAGYAPAEMDAGADLASFLSRSSFVDTHLVLPAIMKPRDLQRAVDRYAAFSPQKLLFTRMDETDSFGSILSQAHRTDKALSFFCFGQQIPEDIEMATKSNLLFRFLRPDLVQVTTAA